ncbi:hypothetical protein HPP92_002877 [Vanilla planifolia]|uniref:Uncharacterized protein n=1 Tax=Vanilla planifolia TaxID=51239 RepID=A0A835RTT4_VANPL|nr:hypothetical protein HPP92_002877 [Vanilla planifolia]
MSLASRRNQNRRGSRSFKTLPLATHRRRRLATPGQAAVSRLWRENFLLERILRLRFYLEDRWTSPQTSRGVAHFPGWAQFFVDFPKPRVETAAAAESRLRLVVVTVEGCRNREGGGVSVDGIVQPELITLPSREEVVRPDAE